MSQNSRNNPNMSTKLRNNSPVNQQKQYQQVRGRSRNHQFRLLSTPDMTDMGDDTTPSAPTVLNIVVPSHISSETSVISSRTNVASLNVVSKSSLPSQFSKRNSWMEQPHSTIKSSNKKFQSEPEAVEKCTSKDTKTETPPMKVCQPFNTPQHDLKYLKQRLLKYRAETDSCGDAAKLNGQLNEIFVRRLVDIDNVAKGDSDIKLVTYQEWVDMLMQINEVIIGNMADLESEVAERLECMKRKIKSSCSQTSNNEQKYRQDICALMQLIKNAYHHDNWDTQGLEFQTINLTEILGPRKNSCPKLKHTNNMKESFDDDQDSNNRCCVNHPDCVLENVIFEAPDIRTCSSKQQSTSASLCTLVIEDADRHDEIYDLKLQICCLEDEIRKAQQTIKLKDDVIKDLRINSRSGNTKLTRNTSIICECGCESATDNMPPINVEQQSSCSASTQVSPRLDSCNQLPFEDYTFDSLSNAGQLEQQKLKALEVELNELFEVTKDLKHQNLEYHRKRLSDIFKKSEAEKADAYRKLDFIRKQLVNLEMSSGESSKQGTNDSDSGFSSKCDSDQDTKILNALRKRLCRINEMNFELKKCVQKLRIENNELSTCLETEKTFAQRNSDTLKDLADMLSGMSGKQFAYDDIYNENLEVNPFCQSIIQMKCDFEEKERTLRNSLAKKCEQLEELQKTRISNDNELKQLQSSTKLSGDCPHNQSKESYKLWDRSNLLSSYDSYLNIVSELKSELTYLSRQVAMVQKEIRESSELDGNSGSKLESSLKILESQNDLLHRALEQVSQDNHKHCSELSQSNENLRGQVQHLQCKMLEKEQCIAKLNSMLDELRCEQQTQQHRAHEWCLQKKEKELREMCQQLEQANKKVESLMSELECSRKQERFLLCESRKLNEELNESKRKHSDLSIQMHRLNTLLKSQESCRTDICTKYEELERSFEDQAKQLRAASAQMNCLQERLLMMDKRQEEHNMERNLLRDEVLALKEKEAILLNKQRCLTEKLMKTEKELYTAHDVMKEQQHIMQRNESSQNDCTKRLQDANNELKRQFNALCDDYKQLEEEFRKQCDLRKQNEKVIESFRKWKEAQLKADDATRASFKQYEEHIKLLLEEKQKFIEQYRNLHGDYCTLQRELESLRMVSLGFNNCVPTSNTSEHSIPQRMELIRSTSLRVSQASSSLKCDITSQDASGSP